MKRVDSKTDMKGSIESYTSALIAQGGTPSGQQGRMNSNTNTTEKPQAKGKDNLWCNCCKGKGHVKETCWKLHGRPPQVHMVTVISMAFDYVLGFRREDRSIER